MLAHLRPAVVMIALFTLLTGLLYPLAITGLAQVLLPAPPTAACCATAGASVGSRLIAQGFARPQYLHPRPSAAGNGYDPTASGGSNYGPLDPKLAQRVAGDAPPCPRPRPAPHPRRRGDRLGLRPRPRHLARERRACRRPASPPPAMSPSPRSRPSSTG